MTSFGAAAVDRGERGPSNRSVFPSLLDRRAAPVAVALYLAACSGAGEDAPPPAAPSRSFAMAFTPWPHDATLPAVAFTYTQVLAHGDWIAHHLDLGVPWEEAYQGLPYAQAVEDELAGRVASTPLGTPAYLAITPLNGGRDGLADRWGAAGAEPLQPPWDTRGFGDPEVAQAFSAYALDLVGRFQPACLNLAIEVSELALNDAAAFTDFLTFEAAVVADLRAQHPGLPLMVSAALKSPGSAEAQAIAAAMPAAVAPLDWLGLSVYPYAFFGHADRGDPANLPPDWLSQGAALAGGRPVAITETGWIAEDLVVPAYSLNVASDPARQDAYLGELFRAADALDARMVVWFTIADYDDLWSGALGQDPLAQLWRDTGLFDGVQQPRPGLATWDDQRALPIR